MVRKIPKIALPCFLKPFSSYSFPTFDPFKFSLSFFGHSGLKNATGNKLHRKVDISYVLNYTNSLPHWMADNFLYLLLRYRKSALI